MKARKILIIILCITAVLLISLGIIKLLPNAIEEKEYKKLNWDSYYGERIPSEYETYKTKDFKVYNFNLDTTNNTTFDIKLPKDVIVKEINSNNIIYTYKKLTFDITKTYSEGIVEELEKVKSNNEYLYEKIYVESAKYDDDIFAIIVEYAKYNGDKTSMMFGQEVRIYIRALENEFALINLDTHETRYDKETLSDIINSITVKKGNNKLCDKNKCEVELNRFHETLNNKFTLDINKDKYVFEYNEGISGLNAYYITKEYAEVADQESEGVKKLTSIELKIIYNNPKYTENLPYQEEIEVDGKKLLASVEKNDLDDVIQYKGTYIYTTDNNVSVIITIDSRLDNLNEVLKDFIKFEI